MKILIFESAIVGTLIAVVLVVAGVALVGPEPRRGIVRSNLRKGRYYFQAIPFLGIAAVSLAFVLAKDEEMPYPLWLGIVVWIAFLVVAFGVGIAIHRMRHGARSSIDERR